MWNALSPSTNISIKCILSFLRYPFLKLTVKEDKYVTSFLDLFLDVKKPIKLEPVLHYTLMKESLSRLLHALPDSYKGFVSLVGNQTNITFDRYIKHWRKEEVWRGWTLLLKKSTNLCKFQIKDIYTSYVTLFYWDKGPISQRHGKHAHFEGRWNPLGHVLLPRKK